MRRAGFGPWPGSSACKPPSPAAIRASSCGEVISLSQSPADRETMSLVWSEHGYPSSGPYRDYHHHTVHHHNPWDNAGNAYDHEAALALARSHAADFVARTRARLCELLGGEEDLGVGALAVSPGPGPGDGGTCPSTRCRGSR